METKEVQELLVKLGLASDSDKEAFRNMYNFVFNPFVKMPSFEQESPPSQRQEIGPEIKAFLAVFRKHFRCPTSPSLSTTVCDQAEAAFTSKLAWRSRSSQMTPDELKAFETKLRTQMQTLEKWIKQVDYCKFWISIREDAVENFKLELCERYCFDSMKFYDEAEIRQLGKELETKILNEYSQEINSKFGEKTKIPEWCGDVLGELMTEVVTDAIRKNKQNEETWNQKTTIAVDKFKEMMATFFKEQPFAKVEMVDSFREETKNKCEENVGLSAFLGESSLKSVWNAKVDVEFRSLEAKWRAEGDGEVESFVETVKVYSQRVFKEKFNLELEGGELQRMFSPQVAETARLKLENAALSECTSVVVADKGCYFEDDNENKNPSEESGGGNCNSDDDGSKTNGANDKGSRSSKSSLASIGIALRRESRIIIPANTKLPTKMFTVNGLKVLDNTTVGWCTIYEADEARANTCRNLGEIFCSDIPPAKAGVERVDVTMKIDALGLLHVEWGVRGSARSKKTAEFKTSAWQGNESDETSEQEADDYPTNKKRSMDTCSEHEDDGSNNSKKAKLQNTTNSGDSDSGSEVLGNTGGG